MTDGTDGATGAGDRRVVITGLGVISSIGTGRDDFAAGLRAGRCGVGPITRFDTTGFAHANAYEVPCEEGRDRLERLCTDAYGRVATHAAAVARMAVTDAGLDLDAVREARTLIALGTTSGEAVEVDRLAESELYAGLDRLPDGAAAHVRPGRLATAVADELDLPDAETVTIPTVCAAGSYAVGYGYDAVAMGDVDVALCGGSDAVSRMAFAGFYRLRAWAAERVRPFDLDRDGFMFADGAGLVVLESLEHARRRGATILAEVAGTHLNCDAEHPTKPSTERVAECIAGAVERAGLGPRAVDLVLAHGTGTRLNDPMEVDAVGRALGLPLPPVTAIKAMLGHTMGAAGVHAVTAAVLAIEQGFIPPTVGFEIPDPDCPVDCVPNVARDAHLDTVVVNSLGLGGNNAAVVVRRFQETAGSTA